MVLAALGLSRLARRASALSGRRRSGCSRAALVASALARGSQPRAFFQLHVRLVAVLMDELDAGGFEGGADGGQLRREDRSPFALKASTTSRKSPAISDRAEEPRNCQHTRRRRMLVT